MAAIGTIRKYSGIAVGFIGVSIIAFIISDAFRADRRIFGNKKNVIGVINGKSITYQEFHNRSESLVEKMKEQQNTENMDEKARSQIRDQLWQTLVDEFLFDKEYKSSGVSVSSDELAYMVTGPEPYPSVKQAFTDPKTGIFDRNQLTNFLKNMDKEPKYKNMWLDFEDNLEKERLRQKYYALIKNSLYVTDVEALDNYYGKNKFAGYHYVALLTKNIPDSLIKPTKKDIEKYYKSHLIDYQVEESRSIEYVVFDITPTKDDTSELHSEMLSLRKEYSETKNDSSYVQVNSETPFDTLYHPRGFFSKVIEDSLLSGRSKITGPYIENNSYKISKITGDKNDTIFYYRASHILIKPTGNTNKDTADAMNKAIRILGEIRRGEDFAKKAIALSEDKGSAVNGGDLNWFKDGAMVKPFMDAVKGSRKGDIVITKTQFGIHIIKVTEDKTNKLFRVGIIQKTIGPSSKTFNKVYYDANNFRSKVNSFDDFQKVINEKGMNKKLASEIKPDANEITGLKDSRRLINWVYKAKLKEISDVIELDNQFIIAILTKANKKGAAPLDDVKSEIEKKVVEQLKLEKLYAKMKAVRDKYNDIDKIAKELDVTVESVTNSSFNITFLANVGEEKYFTGYLFGYKAGKLSPVIKGENAVFVFNIDQFSKVEAPKDLKDIRKEIISNYQGMSQYYAMESLKEKADIKDYRYKFY